MYKDLLDFVQKALKLLNKMDKSEEVTSPYYLSSPIAIHMEGGIVVGEMVNEDGLDWKFVPNVSFTGKSDATSHNDSGDLDDEGQDDTRGSGSLIDGSA